jgi:DNA polymerase-1
MEWAERLAKAYPRRLDQHKNSKDGVMNSFRSDVKNQWTFPLFFGANEYAVAGYLTMPVEKIKPLFNLFWQTFPGVKAWQESMVRMYESKGYVAGLTGRRRHGPMGYNKIINSPIQADEAEMVFDAMCRLSELEIWKFQPNLEVHDDLTFVLEERTLEQDAERIIEEMLFFDALPWVNIVPVTVELSLGDDWWHMKKVDNFSSDTWR